MEKKILIRSEVFWFCSCPPPFCFADYERTKTDFRCQGLVNLVHTCLCHSQAYKKEKKQTPGVKHVIGGMSVLLWSFHLTECLWLHLPVSDHLNVKSIFAKNRAEKLWNHTYCTEETSEQYSCQPLLCKSFQFC